MHFFQPAQRKRGPAKAGQSSLIFGLPPILAGLFLALAPAASLAQTATLIYGSDTSYVAYNSPSPRTAGGTHFITGGSLEMGDQGQFNFTYGAVYDPNPVDVSQGFVSRFNLATNGSNGIAFVIKNPSAANYLETPQNPARGTIYGLGAYGLSSSLGVAFITFRESASNRNDRHFKEVEVFADDANGASTVLADVQGLDIDPSFNGNNVLQVRYLSRFDTLDVYIGQRLIARVPNVDLAKLGIAPDGQAELGLTSGAPPQDLNANLEYFPAFLNHFSIGNQLDFGSGFGPSFYEDRFPFLTTGQSVWGPGSDSVEYQKFLGATSHGQTVTSNTIGTDFSVAGQSIFSLHTSAFASYDVGIGIDATATGGTADISYPLFLDMAFPTQYSVASGTTFSLPMSFYPDLAATINTTTPSANVKADLKCVTSFGVNLDTSVFGQSIASGQLFKASVNIPDTTFFDAQKILTSGLIPNVNGGVNYAGYIQGDEGNTGTKKATRDGTPGEGSSKGAGAGSLLAKFVNVGLTIPDLSTSGSVSGFGTNGSHLTSSASSPFVSLSSDFTNAVLEEIPGLDILTALPFFNNDYTLNLGGHSVELGFHIADIYGDVNLGTAVNYDFTPSPQVYLVLTPEDQAHPNPWGPFALDPTTNKVVNPPVLTMPTDGSPLTVTPRVVLNTSTLQTKGSFTIGGDLSINPLSLSFGYDDNQFSTDPYFGFPLTVSGNVPVYTITKNFAIGNSSGGAAQAVPFQPYIQGKSFTLFATASNNPAIDSITPAGSPVLPATQTGTLPIAIASEHASFFGDVVWDYDGVPTDPQTTLPSRVWHSASSITAGIPNSLLTAQGVHTITLLNHNNGDAQLYPSNLQSFVVNAPAPILSDLKAMTSNGSVIVGGSNFVLAAIGASFSPPVAPYTGSAGYPGSVILWNGKPLVTTYNKANNLTATVPSSLIATAGTAKITVFTAGPGGGTSTPLNLSIVNPAPVLTSLSQTGSAPGTSTLDITLNGSNFVPGASVQLHTAGQTTTRNVSYVSPSSLTLSLSASDLSTPGILSLRVQNPLPGGGTSSALTFTVGQAPVISSGGVSFAPTMSEVSGGYRLSLTVSNTSSTATVNSTIISSVTVGGDSNGKNAIYPILPNPLEPILIGTIPAGGHITPTQTYTFPTSIGAPGQAVILTVRGSSANKTFTTRLRVVLP